MWIGKWGSKEEKGNRPGLIKIRNIHHLVFTLSFKTELIECVSVPHIKG